MTFSSVLSIVDPGFATALNRTGLPNKGKMLENMVLIDLLNRGRIINRDVFYYFTKQQHEVDFFVLSNNKPEMLIQACFDMSDPGTRDREIRSLISAAKEVNCKQLVVVTHKEEELIAVNGINIKVTPLTKWLKR